MKFPVPKLWLYEYVSSTKEQTIILIQKKKKKKKSQETRSFKSLEPVCFLNTIWETLLFSYFLSFGSISKNSQ